MASLEKLMDERKQLESLINGCNHFLDQPLISTKDFQDKWGNTLNKASIKLGPQASEMLQDAMNQGEIDKAIVGVGVGLLAVAVAVVVDAGAEAYSSLAARRKAKKAMEEYKQELFVKTQLIVDQQSKMLQELAEMIDQNIADYEAVYQEAFERQKLIEAIAKSGFLPEGVKIVYSERPE